LVINSDDDNLTRYTGPITLLPYVTRQGEGQPMLGHVHGGIVERVVGPIPLRASDQSRDQ